jgi:Domain of unknown function (DUF4160)
MPEICRFHGIVIAMYFKDHAPPHFHAYSGGRVVRIRIDPIEVINGGIGRRQTALVKRWAALHKNELEKNWLLARDSAKLKPIEPLR